MSYLKDFRQYKPSINLTAPRPQMQKFWLISDCYSDEDEKQLQTIVKALRNAYSPIRMLRINSCTKAKSLIQTTNSDLTIVCLNVLNSSSLSLIDDLLLSTEHPNLIVIGNNLSFPIEQEAAINDYEGGFIAVDRSLNYKDMIHYVSLGMQGVTYLPQTVISKMQLYPQWLELLRLRFEEGLNDSAIAQHMQVSDRTIRNYWMRIQDILLIADDSNKDTKVLIGIEARRMGLIR